MSLQGKRALVTGATSGIGRAVAERLASEGAEVLAVGRDEQRGREVVHAIQSAGGAAEFIRAELDDFADVRRLAQAVGRVDVLVNNAGAFPGGPTVGFSEEDFDLTFDVNVKAPFFLVGALAPQMAEAGGGAIVNISTMAASFGMPGLAAYGASKAALELLTKAWTAEFASQGIRVNAVAPGPTRTPGTAEMGEAFDAIAATIPAGHAADAQDIAATVAFLASDDARFIYGAIVPADGGRVAV